MRDALPQEIVEELLPCRRLQVGSSRDEAVEVEEDGIENTLVDTIGIEIVHVFTRESRAPLEHIEEYGAVSSSSEPDGTRRERLQHRTHHRLVADV